MRPIDRAKWLGAWFSGLWTAKDVALWVAGTTAGSAMLTALAVWAFTPASPFDAVLCALIVGAIVFALAFYFAPKVKTVHHHSATIQLPSAAAKAEAGTFSAGMAVPFTPATTRGSDVSIQGGAGGSGGDGGAVNLRAGDGGAGGRGGDFTIIAGAAYTPITQRHLSAAEKRVLLTAMAPLLINPDNYGIVVAQTDGNDETLAYAKDFYEVLIRVGLEAGSPKDYSLHLFEPHQGPISIAVLDKNRPPDYALKLRTALKAGGIQAPFINAPPEFKRSIVLFIGPTPL